MHTSHSDNHDTRKYSKNSDGSIQAVRWDSVFFFSCKEDAASISPAVHKSHVLERKVDGTTSVGHFVFLSLI